MGLLLTDVSLPICLLVMQTDQISMCQTCIKHDIWTEGLMTEDSKERLLEKKRCISEGKKHCHHGWL